VTLPLAAPALAASGGIAFTYVLGSYEVPWLLGRTSPEPLPVLAYRLFTDVDLATRPQALAVALLTVALSTVAVAATVALVRATAVLR
jgi:putative spermidine/putrescine transport system permease protein